MMNSRLQRISFGQLDAVAQLKGNQRGSISSKSMPLPRPQSQTEGNFVRSKFAEFSKGQGLYHAQIPVLSTLPEKKPPPNLRGGCRGGDILHGKSCLYT